MSDNEIVEIAKAASNVAKTGGKAIDATSAFGRFCDRVFGEGMVQGFGIVSDRVKYVRIKQAIRLEEKVTKLLEEAGVQKTQPVSPVIALPIFESATLEEDENLHTAWANLLATAMDPSRPEVKRSFAGILAELEPSDVLLFVKIVRHSLDARYDSAKERRLDEWRTIASSGTDDFDISFGNLARVGIVSSATKQTALIISGRNDGGRPVYGDVFSVSPLGCAFYGAVAY